ncbi:MAG: serine dehydrogenasease [Candidatus Poribacteria bacterium]|nr:serine dehydrogenasease [Candidatus Poribacteria bacterium]
MATLHPVDHHTRDQLNTYLAKIEDVLEADVLSIFSPIMPGLESTVKNVVEMYQNRRCRIAIVLDTLGGVVEVVERIVSVIRAHYKKVDFLIPDRAMSAGTVFVMAGDRIFMSYFSCLGPIDPQIEKDGEFVPALSYLNQYQRLCEKAEAGTLNSAELLLLNKLDLGELDQFEQARALSRDLLTDWLSKYKFKDWTTHSSNDACVTDADKKKRAQEIADVLSDNERWHSHGRMISRDTLVSEPIRLKIEKLEDEPKLFPYFDKYVGLLQDYVQRGNFVSFVHTREYF